MIKPLVNEYIVCVKFSDTSIPQLFNPNDVELERYDFCVVEGSQKSEEMVGFVSSFESCCATVLLKRKLRKVFRKAKSKDIEKYHDLKHREKKTVELCRKKARNHQLNMKIVDVTFDDDNNKTIFHFTSDKRVDFRDLVKDLAATLKTRIELWQIGVRDEAKAINGYGVCGHIVCCSRFIKNFKPVSIRMAKDQDIILSPSKLSGICGRLMCCLAFEQDTYKELNEESYPVGAIAKTAKGNGEIIDRNMLTKTYSIRDEKGSTSIISQDEITEVSVTEETQKKSEGRMLKDDDGTVPPED